MPQNNPYLTDAEKLRELDVWATRTVETEMRVPDVAAQLNAIHGVCAIEASNGYHACRGDGVTSVTNGAIVLRLDKERTERFFEAMPFLRNLVGAEHVSIDIIRGLHVARVEFCPGMVRDIAPHLVRVLSGAPQVVHQVCECCGRTEFISWSEARAAGWICKTIATGDAATLCPDCQEVD